MRAHDVLRLGAAGSIFVAATLAASGARADDGYPDRTGARVGLSILGGVAGLSNSSAHVSTTTPMVGVALRFGGALFDRVHLYGEFSLAALPGASFPDGSVTGFLGALDLGVQVYALPRLYARAGIGVIEHATLNDGQKYYSLPGPHVMGAVGLDVFRRGERAFALEIQGAEQFYESTDDSTPYNRGYDIALGASFDWF